MGLNLSFLKTLGANILKGLKIAGAVAPSVAQVAQQFQGAPGTVGHVASEIILITNTITAAEVMGQALTLTGAQKLTAAAPQVGQIILNSAFMAGKEIGDQALFMKGCASVGSGFADIMNSIKPVIAQVSI